MLLRYALLCSLLTTYVTARSRIITLAETSCIVDFRANFHLLASQTKTTAESNIGSTDFILEWETLAPVFTGYISYSGTLMCTPTAEPSIPQPTSAISGSNGADVGLTEYPWSWSCVPDSCATVTSLGTNSQLVVNYGSGGPHWSFTAPSRIVDDGLFTYAYSSGCTTTTEFMTVYLPNTTSTAVSSATLTSFTPATSTSVPSATFTPATSTSATSVPNPACSKDTCGTYKPKACPGGVCIYGIDTNHGPVCVLNHQCEAPTCSTNNDCCPPGSSTDCGIICLIENCCPDEKGHCARLTDGCLDSPATSVPNPTPDTCKRLFGPVC